MQCCDTHGGVLKTYALGLFPIGNFLQALQLVRTYHRQMITCTGLPDIQLFAWHPKGVDLNIKNLSSSLKAATVRRLID